MYVQYRYRSKNPLLSQPKDKNFFFVLTLSRGRFVTYLLGFFLFLIPGSSFIGMPVCNRSSSLALTRFVQNQSFNKTRYFKFPPPRVIFILQIYLII